MKQLIIIIMGIVVAVLFNLKSIMAEYSLTRPYESTVEERKWVAPFRFESTGIQPRGSYHFIRTYSNGETMDATYHLNAAENRVMITGTITVGDFIKEIYATADYAIDGKVISYTNLHGHIHLFPDVGHVFSLEPDGKLVLRSISVSLTSV